MVGEEGRGVDRNRCQTRSAGEDAPDDVVEARRRTQEQAALDRPTGDLDKRSSGRDVA